MITSDPAPAPVVGRFAPSPTGPLHFGSLVAAVGSYLDAKSRHGRWLLRIEDVDRPRCSPQAADDILRTLEAFGFAWDGPVVWQSTRDPIYAAALERLQANKLLFPCACTRKELADSTLAADGSALYPGTCRQGLPSGRSARAWRVRVDGTTVEFDDALQGGQTCNLASDVGDFVLKRADGLFAYQLAVVVDDAEAGVTDVVRGADLLLSTPRQIFLQRCLGLPTPRYAHLPVAINQTGEKLSKQTLAPALDCQQATRTLIAALDFLGQAPPAELAQTELPDIWAWALAHWSLPRVPHQSTLHYNPSN